MSMVLQVILRGSDWIRAWRANEMRELNFVSQMKVARRILYSIGWLPNCLQSPDWNIFFRYATISSETQGSWSHGLLTRLSALCHWVPALGAIGNGRLALNGF